MNTTENAISTLKDLIKTSTDGEKGFLSGSEDAKDLSLKQTLRACSQQCAAAAVELQSCVATLGGEADHEGTISGAIHRGWTNLKTSMSSDKDLAILQECERGEDVAKKAYRQALDKDLPADIRAIIERQYQGVIQNHDNIKMLRDARAAIAR